MPDSVSHYKSGLLSEIEGLSAEKLREIPGFACFVKAEDVIIITADTREQDVHSRPGPDGGTRLQGSNPPSESESHKMGIKFRFQPRN